MSGDRQPGQPEPANAGGGRETMNVVIVGHVDHGKSTLVGRLLADTGTLGEGKLDKVRAVCRQQGKQFEYAFLLDALEEEQGQGITIDAARVFFKTARRDYILIDAPGHVEFLKNMVSGAARAEAAVLLIDAAEGVRENSRRHGYLLSMLGIDQIVVAVNKIDLVGYSRDVFEGIVAEYRAFLADLGVAPRHFIPVSARGGDLVTARTEALSWYDGPTILEAVDGFGKRASRDALPLRMPVQDVYKFNHRGDDRRIIAGRVESGSLRVGDRVLFSPSNKSATVASIEAFSAEPATRVSAGRSTGITLGEQIYVSRGEVMSHVDSPPMVSTALRVNLFWLGRAPMRRGQRYKLKLATAEAEVVIDSIQRVLDAGELDARDRDRARGDADADVDVNGRAGDGDVSAAPVEVKRHEVADLVLRTRQPIAFDPAAEIAETGRFVIVDGYDIAGGGIIRDAMPDDLAQRRLETQLREQEWVRGDVTPEHRARLNEHPASMVMFTGAADAGKHALARALEARLVETRHHAYLLDGKNVVVGVDADVAFDDIGEVVRRFGEVAYLLLDAGLIVVSTTKVIGLSDHAVLRTLIAPFELLVVHLGSEAEGLPDGADLRVDPNPNGHSADAIDAILGELHRRDRLRA